MARTRTLIRLTIRQHRFEMFSMATVLLTLTAMSITLTAILRWQLGQCQGLDASSVGCTSTQALGDWAFGALYTTRFVAFFVSITAGVFIGVPLVASEVERSTAFLPWTLGRSRARWLLERVAIVVIWISVCAVVLGLALDLAERVLVPGPPLGVSLVDYQIRGWLVPARVLVAVALGILAGALFGRSLPALLLGVLLTAVVIGATAYAGARLNAADEVIISDDGALFLEDRLQDRTGALFTWDEANARIPFGDPAFDAEFQQVSLGIPGSRSAEIVGREVAINGLVALVAVGLTVVVVDRRRPY